MISRWFHEMGGGLPRQFWYLWSTTLINRSGSFVLIVLTIYLTSERGLSVAFAGLVVGLWGAGRVVGVTVCGVLADRWGRKPTIRAALWAGAAMMVVLGLVQHPIAIAIFTFLTGATADGTGPALSALMVDIVPDRDRPRAFSLHYWVVNLAFAFAATVTGFVADVDLRLLFFADATTTVAAALWVGIMIKEPVRSSAAAVPDPTGAPTVSGGLAAVLRDRVFLAFVGANLLMVLVFLQATSTLPISMTSDGLSASSYGWVIALNGAFIVVGQFFVTRALRGLDHTTVLAFACVVVGVGFGLTALATTPTFYAITVLVWTVGEMLQAPSSATTLAALSPGQLRGRYQGVFAFSWGAASFLAPMLGGTVLQLGGKATLWLGCLGLSVAAAAMHYAARAGRDRRAAQIAGAEATQCAPEHIEL